MLRFTLALIVALTIACAGCASSQRAAAHRPARVNHLAYAKLIDPSQAEALVADCDTHLRTIPGVVSYFCGMHLDLGRGALVESDYDVALYLGFNTSEDCLAYVAHPSHVMIVERWKPRLQWLRVHDVLDESP